MVFNEKVKQRNRTKSLYGIKNPTFYKITKNKDEKGHILTYTVHLPKYNIEVNTIKEARVLAIKV